MEINNMKVNFLFNQKFLENCFLITLYSTNKSNNAITPIEKALRIADKTNKDLGEDGREIR